MVRHRGFIFLIIVTKKLMSKFSKAIVYLNWRGLPPPIIYLEEDKSIVVQFFLFKCF